MANYQTEYINEAIRKNELQTSEWELNPLVKDLYKFVDIFNFSFFKYEPVPTPALTFEKSNIRVFGYYRIGLNDWAVRNQINLNRVYLDSPQHELLQILIHEMVHSWEYIYADKSKLSKSWYHAKSFRDKMAEIGIKTNEKGHHLSIEDPFLYLLERQGIELPVSSHKSETAIILPPKQKPKGKSKLAKWSCGCTNIRVGVKDLEALCLKCNNIFELQDE